MSGAIEVESWRVSPPREGELEPEKLREIGQSMTEGGWQGRPLLLERLGGPEDEAVYQAWTGTHRWNAADAKNLPIRGYEVDGRKMAAKRVPKAPGPNGVPSYFGSTESDEERYLILTAAGDLPAAALMRAELRGNVSPTSEEEE